MVVQDIKKIIDRILILTKKNELYWQQFSNSDYEYTNSGYFHDVYYEQSYYFKYNGGTFMLIHRDNNNTGEKYYDLAVRPPGQHLISCITIEYQDELNELAKILNNIYSGGFNANDHNHLLQCYINDFMDGCD